MLDPALYPGSEALTGAIRRLDPDSARGFFLHGGYDDAKVVSPGGLRFSMPHGGRAMQAGSARVELAQDDFALLRPRQRQGVFLRFGDIAVYHCEAFPAWWPTFSIHA